MKRNLQYISENKIIYFNFLNMTLMHDDYKIVSIVLFVYFFKWHFDNNK